MGVAGLEIRRESEKRISLIELCSKYKLLHKILILVDQNEMLPLVLGTKNVIILINISLSLLEILFMIANTSLIHPLTFYKCMVPRLQIEH